MTKISKEEAIELAIKCANDLKLKESIVAGAYRVEDNGDPYWRVLLEFVDNADVILELPQDIGINVDESTGRAWMLKSL